MMWTISGRSEVFLEALEQLVICSRGSDPIDPCYFKLLGLLVTRYPHMMACIPAVTPSETAEVIQC